MFRKGLVVIFRALLWRLFYGVIEVVYTGFDGVLWFRGLNSSVLLVVRFFTVP